MTAPQKPPMEEKHFLLRVFSVKRTSEKQEPQDPTEETWEVRADTALGDRYQASLFYTEVNPRNLPPADSLLRVAIDDRVTEESTLS